MRNMFEIASSEAVSKNETEIAAVIRAETAAFQCEDFDAWADCFIQDERTVDVYISSAAGLSIYRGWDEVADNMRTVFRHDISCKVVDFGQDNLRISVSGDAAWVVYDGWSIAENGWANKSFETRILERKEGRWKIVMAIFIEAQIDGLGAKTLAVDAKGRVVQASVDALDVLRSHPILTISAGRLRAHRLSWDKELQRALMQAGKHHGFFQTHKFADQMGGLPEYPVILGNTDEGGVAVVQLLVRNGVTFVRVDADDVLDRHLRLSQRVFSLSDGQVRVAREISLGKGLKEVAKGLGVSVNTARTHLSRLYEKTGVNSQAALVRVLLSVG